jgi:hypothetical protein
MLAPITELPCRDEASAQARARTWCIRCAPFPRALLLMERRCADINVKFTGCTGFEYTPEIALFDQFRTRLVHGWVYDPQEVDVAR